jgi:hypothetical protein
MLACVIGCTPFWETPMAEQWLLIFIFKAAIYASGPHELDTCRVMQASAAPEDKAVCVNKDHPRIRISTPPKEARP